MSNRASFIPVDDPRPDDTAWPQMSWPLAPDVHLRGHVVDLYPADPERDGPAAFEALDHAVVWEHVAGRPRSLDKYVEMLSSNLDEGRVPWIVRLLRPFADLPAGSVVGTSSYLDVSVEDARLEMGSTAYTPPVWGTAVNPDVKLQLFAHAFEVLGVGRVQLKTDVRNLRSQRAIARMGAVHEGTLRRYQRRADGTARDTVLFSVLAEDWPMVRDRLRARVISASMMEEQPASLRR